MTKHVEDETETAPPDPGSVGSLSSGRRPRRRSRGQENVAAAVDAVAGVGDTVARAAASIRRRVEELEDMLLEVQEEYRKHQLQSAQTEQELRTRLEDAESRLRRIQIAVE